MAERAPAAVEPEERTTSERDGLHVSDPLDAVRAALGPGLVARLPDGDVPVGLRQLTSEQLQALADKRQVVVDRSPSRRRLSCAACSATAVRYTRLVALALLARVLGRASASTSAGSDDRTAAHTGSAVHCAPVSSARECQLALVAVRACGASCPIARVSRSC